jgi:hypothetical protein
MGSEFLARKPSIGRVKESHEFAYFSHGEPGNAMAPAVDIALDTGVRGNKASGIESSITDDHFVNTALASRSVTEVRYLQM